MEEKLKRLELKINTIGFISLVNIQYNMKFMDSLIKNNIMEYKGDVNAEEMRIQLGKLIDEAFKIFSEKGDKE